MIKDLEGLFDVERVVLRDLYTGGSVSERTKVQVGLLHPSCDRLLYTFSKCSLSNSSFLCPKLEQPSAFLLINSDSKFIAETRKTRRRRRGRSKEDKELDAQLIENRQLISIFSSGLSSLPALPNSGYFVLLNASLSSPLAFDSSSPPKPTVFLSTYRRGTVIWFSNHAFLPRLTSSSLSALLSNLHNVCRRRNAEHAISWKRIYNSRLPSHISSSDLLLWDAHERLNPDDLQYLLEDHVGFGGGCMAVFLKPWSYSSGRNQLTPLLTAADASLGAFLAKGDAFSIGAAAMTALDELPSIALRLATRDGTLERAEAAANGAKVLQGHPSPVRRRLVEAAVKSLTPEALRLTPCRGYPLTNRVRARHLDAISDLSTNQLLAHSGIKSTAASVYPGRLLGPVTSAAVHRLALSGGTAGEWLASGLYIPPGVTAAFNVIGGSSEGWQASVQWNEYNLASFVKREGLCRLPSTSVQLSVSVGKIYTPFGGLLWFQQPSESAEVQLEVTGAVEAPFYDALGGEEGKETWRRSREATAAPWSVVAGRRLVFVAPSGGLKGLAEPWRVLDIYDRCVDAMLDLRGINTTERRRREIVAGDVQTRAGGMSNGYPITVHLSHFLPSSSSFLLSPRLLQASGSWGLFHELGHNLQNPAWTWAGEGEVTNNIFTLKCQQLVAGEAVWSEGAPWLQGGRVAAIRRFLAAENMDGGGGGPFVRLAVHAQLQSVFGWELFRRIFRSYNRSPPPPSASSSSLRDFWVLTASRLSGFDLSPTFGFWSWSISQSTRQTLSHLPAFLPDDFSTRMAPHRVAVMEAIFGPRLRRKASKLTAEG